VVERETETGNVLQLDAVAETPQWDEEGPTHAQVTQVYTAARPFWRSTSESNASANYNGAVPVNLACNNTGDLPSWARFVIDGQGIVRFVQADPDYQDTGPSRKRHWTRYARSF